MLEHWRQHGGHAALREMSLLQYTLLTDLRQPSPADSRIGRRSSYSVPGEEPLIHVTVKTQTRHQPITPFDR